PRPRRSARADRLGARLARRATPSRRHAPRSGTKVTKHTKTTKPVDHEEYQLFFVGLVPFVAFVPERRPSAVSVSRHDLSGTPIAPRTAARSCARGNASKFDRRSQYLRRAR